MDANFLFNRFFESLADPIDKEKFSAWIIKVAEKITEIAVDINDDKLINTILEDESFHEIFGEYYDSMLIMFKENVDIEKAAYEILNIMTKNKRN